MTKFIIEGGHKLKGVVTVSGSKNAALPILAATLLTDEVSTLRNVPDIEDIHSMIKIIEDLGVKIEFNDNTLTVDPSEISNKEMFNDVVRTMRASILLIGSLLPRFKDVKMDFPGGCVLGKRSVNAHMHAFQELGAEVIDEEKYLHIKAENLKGKKIILPELSVTATENVIMSAVLAEGTTEIRLAATEPHVQDLCHFLNKMGAKISGVGTNFLKIEGVKKLSGIEYSITGDYLEAGTFAIAGLLTNGDIIIKGVDPNHLDSFFEKIKEIGGNIMIEKEDIHILPQNKGFNAIPTIQTAVYPGFATDLQAPFGVLLTQSVGNSKIFETLFEGRLSYLFELEKMGANIEILNPHQAIIKGKTELKGVPISSCDIRAGAAMVLSALIAEGTTEISNVYYIDRGYEKLDEKLNTLGAKIHRVST